MLGCDNSRLGSHGHDRIEIASCQGIGQIAEIVGEKCIHQGEVGAQRRLNQVAFSIDVDLLLSFLNGRSDSGRSQYSTEPKTAGANALDKRALWNKVDRHFSIHHLPLGLWVESNVTCDGPPHEALIDEFSDTAAW